MFRIVIHLGETCQPKLLISQTNNLVKDSQMQIPQMQHFLNIVASCDIKYLYGNRVCMANHEYTDKPSHDHLSETS